MIASDKLFSQNFIYFSQGVFISLIGNNIRQVATSFLIADITNSPLFLGTTTMFMGMACLLSGLLLPNLAGHLPKKKTLIFCDLTNGLLVICFGLLVNMASEINYLIYPALFIFPLAREIITTLYTPMYISFIADITHHSLHARANAVINTLQETAAIAGKSCAGILYRIWGPAPLLILDGLTYFISVISFTRIHITPEPPEYPKAVNTRNLWPSIKEGFEQLLEIPGIHKLLILDASHWFVAAPIFTLLPFFIKAPQFLDSSTDWYGFFFAAWGDRLNSWLLVQYISVFKKKLPNGNFHHLAF